MKKSEYVFKRTCLMLCANALKNLRLSSKEIIHKQMIRMNEELDNFHKKNKRKVIKK